MNRIGPIILAVALLGIIGCAGKQLVQTSQPDYTRPLAPGASALRPVTDPARMPDLEAAGRGADEQLLASIDESLFWFDQPSSRRCFPLEGITHERARTSLVAMREIILAGPSPRDFAAEVRRRFDVYESVGCDGAGTVLFTGYYAPVFRASRTPTEPFLHPLHRRPPDLVTDPATGAALGRRLPDGSIVPYDTRREIEDSGRLAGRELVWLADPLDAYIVHVNGSARLDIVDPASGRVESVMYVGYAGKNGRPYTGLGDSMVEAGLLARDEISMSAVKAAYRRDPQTVVELIRRNDSYVFFTEYDGDTWPAGSLGVQVTARRTLATDKKIYPRGGLVLVDTRAMSVGGRQETFLQLMLDQDTGGAIRAPGRADIFMGVGPDAEVLAGGQYAEGRLYYLFLKPGPAG